MDGLDTELKTQENPGLQDFKDPSEIPADFFVQAFNEVAVVAEWTDTPKTTVDASDDPEVLADEPVKQPSTIDSNNTGPDDDPDEEVGKVHVTAAKLMDTLLKKTHKAGEGDHHDPNIGGYRNPVMTGEENAGGNSKKEKEKAALNRHLMILEQQREINARLAELAERIGEIDIRLAEIDVELEEIDELENLIKEGKIDPNNPEHKRLMDKYKVTEEDLASGYWVQILNGQRDDLNAEKIDLIDERKDVAAKANKLREGVESAESKEEIKNLLKESELSEDGQRIINKANSELTSRSKKIEVTKAMGLNARDQSLVIRGALDKEDDLNNSSSAGFSYDSLPSDSSGISVASTFGESAFDIEPLSAEFNGAADLKEATPVAENEQTQSLPQSTVTVSDTLKFPA